MTVQPTRDQLLDQLDRAERRIARLEAQTSIRGRAVVMYRERAREAEAERDEWRQTALDERGAALDQIEQVKIRDARIKAVREMHDADGVRWVGFPRADEQVTYCTYCQERSPCTTIRTLDGTVPPPDAG